MKKLFIFKSIVLLSLLATSNFTFGQVIFQDDFSSATPWTQYGTTLTVSSGTANFSATPCGSDRRICRPLSFCSNFAFLPDTWEARIEFKATNFAYTGVGHYVLCFTSNNVTPDQLYSGGPNSDEDIIGIYLSCPLYQNNLSDFKIRYKSGTSDGVNYSGTGIPAAINTNYHLKLCKINSTTLTLGRYDANYSTLIGTAITMTIPTLRNLTHVQMCSYMNGGTSRTLTAKEDSLTVRSSYSTLSDYSCEYFFDYSSSTGWNTVGTGVSITGGVVQYDNCRDGFEERRIYYSLPGGALGNRWKTDFEFTPTYAGNKTTDAGPGHEILALTAGTQDPIATGPSGTVTDQDAIYVGYANDPLEVPSNPTHYYLTARIKDGTTFTTYTPNNIVLSLNTTYYITVQRLDVVLYLGVFLDACHTNLVGQNCIDISGSITGLNTLQHSNCEFGAIQRILSGTVDNVCIKEVWSAPNLCYSGGKDAELNNGNASAKPPCLMSPEYGVYGISHSDFTGKADISPNPTNGVISIQMNGITGKVSIRVISLEGQLIYSEEIENSMDIFNKRLDLSALPKGVYMLNIKNNENTINKKLILQ